MICRSYRHHQCISKVIWTQSHHLQNTTAHKKSFKQLEKLQSHQEARKTHQKTLTSSYQSFIPFFGTHWPKKTTWWKVSLLQTKLNLGKAVRHTELKDQIYNVPNFESWSGQLTTWFSNSWWLETCFLFVISTWENAPFWCEKLGWFNHQVVILFMQENYVTGSICNCCC